MTERVRLRFGPWFLLADVNFNMKCRFTTERRTTSMYRSAAFSGAAVVLCRVEVDAHSAACGVIGVFVHYKA